MVFDQRLDGVIQGVPTLCDSEQTPFALICQTVINPGRAVRSTGTKFAVFRKRFQRGIDDSYSRWDTEIRQCRNRSYDLGTRHLAIFQHAEDKKFAEREGGYFGSQGCRIKAHMRARPETFSRNSCSVQCFRDGAYSNSAQMTWLRGYFFQGKGCIGLTNRFRCKFWIRGLADGKN
jgi:hypothetical protein